MRFDSANANVWTQRSVATPAAPGALSAQQAELVAQLPDAERQEASDATAIPIGPPPLPPSDADLAPLRTMMLQARDMLGIEAAFKDDTELVPYLTTLLKAHAVETYDREGFLRGEAAVRSSFTDVVLHQRGLAAGFHAAVEEMLDVLSPEAMGESLNGRTFLMGARTAALWAAYEQAHAEAQKLAESETGVARSPAFREAYDDCVNQPTTRA